MSSDNYLLVQKVREDRFRLLDLSASVDYSKEEMASMHEVAPTAYSLEEAMAAASTYLKENIVEYGVRLDLDGPDFPAVADIEPIEVWICPHGKRTYTDDRGPMSSGYRLHEGDHSVCEYGSKDMKMVVFEPSRIKED